jgi:hypothetical protein
MIKEKSSHTVKFLTINGKVLRMYQTNDRFPNKFFWEKVKAEQLAKVSRDHDIPAERIQVIDLSSTILTAN